MPRLSESNARHKGYIDPMDALFNDGPSDPTVSETLAALENETLCDADIRLSNILKALYMLNKLRVKI